MKKIALITIPLLLTGAPSLFAQDFDVEAAWSKECRKCHAEDGSGLTKKGRQLKLQDYRKVEVQSKFTDEEMHEAIKEGVSKNGEELMNAYADKFSDEEIDALVSYIRDMATN